MNISFDIVSRPDFWTIVTRYMGNCDTTFSQYTDMTWAAIKYGYLDIIKEKQDLFQGSELSMIKDAIKEDRVDIVKWLIETVITREEDIQIQWTTVKSLKMVEYLYTKFNKKKIHGMARVTIFCPVDVVVYLNKHGCRTSASAFKNAFNEHVKYNNHTVSLEKLQYLQKNYRTTITYDVLSRLEVRDNNEEYIKTHNLMECARKNTKNPFDFIHNKMRDFNLTFLKLYDRMEELSTYLSQHTESLELLYTELFEEGRIDIIEYLLDFPEISLRRFNECGCVDNLWCGFLNTLERIDCAALSRLLTFSEIREILPKKTQISIKAIYRLNSSLEPSVPEILGKIRILRENGFEIVSDDESFRICDSILLNLNFVKTIRSKDVSLILWYLYNERNGIFVTRYVHHFLEWSDPTVHDRLFYPDEKPETPLEKTFVEFFNMAAMFMQESNPHLYRNIRWFYYNRLRQYLCTEHNLDELDALVATGYVDPNVRRLDRQMLISLHKIVYPILIAISKFDFCGEVWMQRFTRLVLPNIMDESLVELVPYYVQYSPQYVNIYDFTYVAVKSLKKSIIMALIELKPEVKPYVAAQLRMLMWTQDNHSEKIKSINLFDFLLNKYENEEYFDIDPEIQ